MLEIRVSDSVLVAHDGSSKVIKAMAQMVSRVIISISR